MKIKLMWIIGGLVLCFLLAGLALAQDLWDIKKSRTSTMDIDDFFMATETIGWAITGDNKIYKTIDGCVTWNEQTNPSTKDLSEVYFRNTNTGFIFGANALCLKTTDGGSNWNIITLPVPESLNYVSKYFLDDNLGWMGLYKSEFHGCVIKTTDGGDSWTYYGMVDSTVRQGDTLGWGWTGRPWPIFWTADSGAVGAGRGTTDIRGYYTVNGGQTWTLATITATTNEKYRPSDDLFKTGSTSARWFALRGAMLKTTNRGVNWVSDNTWWNRYNTYPAIRDVEQVNDNVGYYSVNTTAGNGWNQIGRTSTAWASFDSTQYVYTTPGAPATTISFVSEAVGFAKLRGSPVDNFILKTTDYGSTWTPVDPNAWPPWSLDRIWKFADDNYMAIGYCTAPSKSTDGGDTWALPSALTRTQPPVLPYTNSTDLNDIDARAGVMIGATGWTWQNRSTDNGNTWGSVTCPGTSVTHYCVTFANDNIAVAGAGTGKMSRTTNAGTSWTSLTTIARMGFIYSIRFKDALNGYMIGSKGVIYGSTDAGATWTYRDSIYSASYYDMEFVNANLAYVVGYRGYLGKSTDGGTNWDLVDSLGYDTGSSTYGPTCYVIEFANDLEGWIGAASGVVYHTYDGGTTWAKEPAITTPLTENPTVNDLKYYSGSCELLASGSLGFIGKYQSNAPHFTKQYYLGLLIPVNIGYTLTFWVTAWDSLNVLDTLYATMSGVGSWPYTPGVSPVTGNYSWTPLSTDTSSTPYVLSFDVTDCWGSTGNIGQLIHVFTHGDANSDNKVTVSDVVFVINYLFKSGPPPAIMMAGDVNGDTDNCSSPKVTISDVVYTINYLFKSGPAPVINATCLPIQLP